MIARSRFAIAACASCTACALVASSCASAPTRYDVAGAGRAVKGPAGIVAGLPAAAATAALAPVYRAYTRTLGLGDLSEVLVLSERGTTGALAGAMGSDFTLSLSGTIAPASGDGSFRMAVNGPGVLAQALSSPRTVILTSARLYLQTPLALTASVGPSPWIELPASAFGSFLLPVQPVEPAGRSAPDGATSGALAAEPSAAASVHLLAVAPLGDPSGLLQLWDVPAASLRSSKAVLPDGAHATRYRVLVNVDAAARLPGLAGAFYAGIRATRALRTVTFTIYVDSAGIARSISMDLPLQQATVVNTVPKLQASAGSRVSTARRDRPSRSSASRNRRRISRRSRSGSRLVTPARLLRAQPAISLSITLSRSPVGAGAVLGAPPAGTVGAVPGFSPGVRST